MVSFEESLRHAYETLHYNKKKECTSQLWQKWLPDGEIILLVTQEVVIEPLWQLGGGTAAASLGPPWALELNFHFLIKF